MSDAASKRRVKDVLSKDLVAVSADDTLHDAIELMTENRVTSLPVLNGQGKCIGVLSAADLIELSRELQDELRDYGREKNISHEWVLDKLDEHDMTRRTVSEVMTREVATISHEKRLTDAASAMLRHRVHHLPVVDGDGKMLGIISTMDLLSVLAESAGG